jgi:DNA (cytosine-5)-methyltransferase 1
MLTVLDLFSGIGGFSLGLESTGGFSTVAFCEIDPFCQKVLRKHWPEVPIYDDIKDLSTDGLVHPDIITAGFPCQPASYAGKRSGSNDDRWFWPALFEVVRGIKPTWCIFENVYGLITLEQGMVFESCLSEMENEGYDIQAVVIPACGVNAPHRRDRVWIIAHTDINSKSELPVNGKPGQGELGTVANAASVIIKTRVDRQEKVKSRRSGNGYRRSEQWTFEPNVGRVAHGVPRRVDRLRSLGNAVVPQVVAQIGYAILTANDDKLR